MARCDQRGGRFAVEMQMFLVKRDSLIRFEDWRTLTDDAIAMPDGCRNMANLVTEGFAPMNAAPEFLERAQEKRPDVVRLQSVGLRPRHFVANVANAVRVEPLVNQ